MSISQNNIVTVTSGDSVAIPVRIKDKERNPVDISAMDIFFTARDKLSNIIIIKDSITGGIVKMNQLDPDMLGLCKVLFFSTGYIQHRKFL